MEREVINHFSIRGGTQIDIRRSFFIGYIALPIQIFARRASIDAKRGIAANRLYRWKTIWITKQVIVSTRRYDDFASCCLL